MRARYASRNTLVLKLITLKNNKNNNNNNSFGPTRIELTILGARNHEPMYWSKKAYSGTSGIDYLSIFNPPTK